MASSLHRIINSVAQPWKEKQINVRWSHLLLVICWFILKLLGSPANYNRRHVTSRIFRRVTRKDQKDKQPYPKNPAGKSRPQIHMNVGGNPGGRHAISTPTDTKHTRRTSFTADTLNVLVHGAHTHIRPLTGVTKGLRDTSENMIMLLVLEPALFACTFGRPFLEKRFSWDWEKDLVVFFHAMQIVSLSQFANWLHDSRRASQFCYHPRHTGKATGRDCSDLNVLSGGHNGRLCKTWICPLGLPWYK